MKAILRQRILGIVRTDSTFDVEEYRGGRVWVGKCLHCNARLMVRLDGEPLGNATIEHIVPRTHGGTDDVENLALACARCNNQKGVHLDTKNPTDARYQEVIAALQQRRRARWRESVD